jgi:hypothetical protein
MFFGILPVLRGSLRCLCVMSYVLACQARTWWCLFFFTAMVLCRRAYPGPTMKQSRNSTEPQNSRPARQSGATKPYVQLNALPIEQIPDKRMYKPVHVDTFSIVTRQPGNTHDRHTLTSNLLRPFATSYPDKTHTRQDHRSSAITDPRNHVMLRTAKPTQAPVAVNSGATRLGKSASQRRSSGSRALPAAASRRLITLRQEPFPPPVSVSPYRSYSEASPFTYFALQSIRAMCCSHRSFMRMMRSIVSRLTEGFHDASIRIQ